MIIFAIHNEENVWTIQITFFFFFQIPCQYNKLYQYLKILTKYKTRIIHFLFFFSVYILFCECLWERHKGGRDGERELVKMRDTPERTFLYNLEFLHFLKWEWIKLNSRKCHYRIRKVLVVSDRGRYRGGAEVRHE